MAKPRVFVSSTYYDLKYVRQNLKSFIEGIGYEPVLFENGDIPFAPDKSLEDSCYAELDNCHMLVLIIGGRLGSLSSEHRDLEEDKKAKLHEDLKSITRKEFETARKKEIPTFIFIEKSVRSEYLTYTKNKDNPDVEYAHVDDVKVFELVDDIIAAGGSNFLKEFDHIDDIIDWLRDQWAGLFADFLSKRSEQSTLKSLEDQVKDLSQLSATLKEYNEAILQQVNPDDSQSIISEQTKKREASKARRLYKEDMNHYLREEYNVKKPARSFLSVLYGSNNLESYLELLGMSKMKRQKFLQQNASQAKDDYNRFKSRYDAEEFSD